MTAPATLFDLPAVQDAINFALGKLADWQLVPQRVSVAQGEIQRLASAAAQAGDAGKIAQLTLVKQSLDGVAREYQDAAPLVSEVIQAARTAQGGGSVNTATIADAAKLATILAANLSVLAQDERALVQLGGRLDVGPGGGVYLPPWVKMGLIVAGVWFLLRRVL